MLLTLSRFESNDPVLPGLPKMFFHMLHFFLKHHIGDLFCPIYYFLLMSDKNLGYFLSIFFQKYHCAVLHALISTRNQFNPCQNQFQPTRNQFNPCQNHFNPHNQFNPREINSTHKKSIQPTKNQFNPHIINCVGWFDFAWGKLNLCGLNWFCVGWIEYVWGKYHPKNKKKNIGNWNMKNIQASKLKWRKRGQ